MNIEDIYEEVRELILMLGSQGFLEWSEKLKESLEFGFTASEILMGLRFNLEKLINSKDVDGEILKRSRQLHSEIEKALTV